MVGECHSLHGTCRQTRSQQEPSPILCHETFSHLRLSTHLKDILRNTFQEKNIAQIWQDKGKFYKRNDAKKINNGKPEPK